MEMERECWRVAAMEISGTEDLSPSARVIWLVVLLRMSETGWCMPRIKRLHEITKLHPETIRRALRELVVAGLVNRKERFSRNGRRMSSHMSLTARARVESRGGEVSDRSAMIAVFEHMQRKDSE